MSKSSKDSDNPRLDELFSGNALCVRESVELIEGASEPFSLEKFLSGEQTPVFFGSGVMAIRCGRRSTSPCKLGADSTA